MKGAALEIRQYGQKDGSCFLYEDDGQSYDFEKGTFRLRELSTKNGQLEQKQIKMGESFYGGATLRMMTPKL